MDALASGKYQISGALCDPNGSEIVSFIKQDIAIKSGKNLIEFLLDGKTIGDKGLEGPYTIRGVSCHGKLNLIENNFEPLPYTLQQFEQTVSSSTRNVR